MPVKGNRSQHSLSILSSRKRFTLTISRNLLALKSKTGKLEKISWASHNECLNARKPPFWGASFLQRALGADLLSHV